MKGTSNIVSTIHHLKLAEMNMTSFIKERPHAALTDTFRKIKPKIPWMFDQLKATKEMPQIVRDGMNQEINSDVVAMPAIYDKISLLSPQGRDAIESLIDRMLAAQDREAEKEEQ